MVQLSLVLNSSTSSPDFSISSTTREASFSVCRERGFPRYLSALSLYFLVPSELWHSTSISQYSSGMNFSISSSRSQMIRRATDWTLPADSPRLTLFQRRGLSWYPTSLSRTRRALLRIHPVYVYVIRFLYGRGHTVPGLFRILILHLDPGSMSRRYARCHAIASPSLSGSDARSVLPLA